jgi:hypothetical protein
MIVPFESADDVCDRFLSLLQRLKIDPPIGSNLEDELLSAVQLMEVARNPGLVRDSVHEGQILRSAAGMFDLAAKVLSVEPLSEFELRFVPHLRLIEKLKVRVASLGQNAINEYDDDTARKIAELYVGCLAAQFGTDVDLDHPDKSKGDNPDVMFNVEDLSRGRARWALAIKTIGETSGGQTVFDRIRDGASQVDDPKCKADHGMVVINAKNHVDHDALWKADFADREAAEAGLRDELTKVIGKAARDRPQEEWDALFAGRTIRPIVFMAQTVVRIPTPIGLLPTPLGMMLADGANGACDGHGEAIARDMNHYMQIIRRGIPASIGRYPR